MKQIELEAEDYLIKSEKIICNIWNGRKLCGLSFDDIIRFYEHVKLEHKDILL